MNTGSSSWVCNRCVDVLPLYDVRPLRQVRPGQPALHSAPDQTRLACGGDVDPATGICRDCGASAFAPVGAKAEADSEGRTVSPPCKRLASWREKGLGEGLLRT